MWIFILFLVGGGGGKRKHYNSTKNYIQTAYLEGILVFGGLFLMVKKKQFKKIYFIIIFHH